MTTRYEQAAEERASHIEMHVAPERGLTGCGCRACGWEMAKYDIKESPMDAEERRADEILAADIDLEEAAAEFLSRALDVRYHKDKLAVAEAHEKNAYRWYMECKRTLEQLQREPLYADSEALTDAERNPSLR